MSRLLRVLAVVCVLVVLPVQPAKACSCAYGDPRDRFADADGAFVGTFVESHPVEPNPSSSGADTIYTFLLEEEYKGELGDPGDTVEVHAPLSGASCGIEAAPGQRYGLFLDVRDDGAWSSNLCSQVSPGTMREAASPLPAPTSDGPVRFVAGGSFGDTQTMLLDARGRTVAYGAGDSDVVYVSGCRGRGRMIEIGIVYPGPAVLVVRDVSSQNSVRSVELPIGGGPKRVSGAHCLSKSGRRAVVFAADHEGRAVLLEVTGTDVDVLWRGDARGAAFAGRRAYIEKDGALGRVSLRTGAERRVTSLPGDYTSELAVSPDGTKLAGVAYPAYDRSDERPSQVFVVDLTRRRIRTASLGTGERDAHVRWLSDKRLAMFVLYPDASRVYDMKLEVRSRFGRWQGHTTAIVGDTAYGVDYEGGLWSVDLPGGTPERVRRLPSPVVYDLAPLE